jgi:hypothetical protein
MTPGRALAVGLILVLGVVMALGSLSWWNDPGAASRSDEDYIAIARSEPTVFRAGKPERVAVDRSGRLAVDFWFETERIRVFIQPRTDRVEEVVHFPR